MFAKLENPQITEMGISSFSGTTEPARLWLTNVRFLHQLLDNEDFTKNKLQVSHWCVCVCDTVLAASK